MELWYFNNKDLHKLRTEIFKIKKKLKQGAQHRHNTRGKNWVEDKKYKMCNKFYK